MAPVYPFISICYTKINIFLKHPMKTDDKTLYRQKAGEKRLAHKIEDYIERIYGYAVKHTFNRDEADELSQEICLTALRQFPKLRDAGKFEPWLWALAGNVTKQYQRACGKQRATVSYDSLESLSYQEEEEGESDDQERCAYLREKIAMLSSLYRDIVILYYYDGLSTSQIAQRLNMPEGTVTWRLSQARNKLKKEYENMTETALRPVKLQIRISGSGHYNGTTSPFPYVYISDALSVNLLYYCYEKPKKIDELAKLCGVPAFYVEDSIQNLLKRQAVTEPVKGKYQTNFIIYSNQVDEYRQKARPLFAPVVRPFVESMERLCKDCRGLGHYTAGKDERTLIYLYALLALEHLSKTHNPTPFTPPPVRYDGFRWSYHAHLMRESNAPIRGLGREETAGPEGRTRHISYHFGGFSYRAPLLEHEISICERILQERKIEDTEAAAGVIAKGFAEKVENGRLAVLVPAFTQAQKERFNQMAEAAFAPCIHLYTNAVSQYIRGYKRLFPKHLEEDAARACSYMFLTLFAVDLCDIARQEQLLPPADGGVCDVLIQSKA